MHERQGEDLHPATTFAPEIPAISLMASGSKYFWLNFLHSALWKCRAAMPFDQGDLFINGGVYIQQVQDSLLNIGERIGKDLDHLIFLVKFMFGQHGKSIQDLCEGGRLGI